MRILLRTMDRLTTRGKFSAKKIGRPQMPISSVLRAFFRGVGEDVRVFVVVFCGEVVVFRW